MQHRGGACPPPRARLLLWLIPCFRRNHHSPQVPRPSPTARTTRRRVIVSDAAPEPPAMVEELSSQRAYLRQRGGLLYWGLLFAMVYVTLFLPTRNRLPAVLDLSWAGLTPSAGGAVEEAVVAVVAPLINDVPRDATTDEAYEAPPAPLHQATAEQEEQAGTVEEVQQEEGQEEAEAAGEQHVQQVEEGAEQQQARR